MRFFENQHNVVQSIRFILEIFSRDPKDFSIYFQTVIPLHFPLQSNIGLIGVLSSVNRLDSTNGRHFESNILANILKIV